MSRVDVELSDLRLAVVTSQHRSLRQAAEALNIRQSTLSRRLHEIERQLDVVLFERTKGGTNLTTVGREFVASAMRILDGVDTELRRIKSRSRGELERRVPFYEAKMIHHFDHRWATYSPDASDDEESARDCTVAEKQSPNFEPSPRYWVPEEEVVLRAARVPAALKGAVRQVREGGKARGKASTDLEEGARAAALKALVIWIAGAFSALKDRSARKTDLFRLLGRAQDWRGAQKVSPERFLLDPKTLIAGAGMQRETPLSANDLTRLVDEPKDALVLAELLIAAKQPRWLMGWRDITNATNERTVVGGPLAKAGVGNNLPIWYPGSHVDGKHAAALAGMLTSLTFDFSARHKVGGTHLNFFIAQQLPVLPPSAFSRDDFSFITPRVLELTYTSHAMKPWAEDLGYSGQPFAWNEDRRAQVRAELDAFFAKKTALPRKSCDMSSTLARLKAPTTRQKPLGVEGKGNTPVRRIPHRASGIGGVETDRGGPSIRRDYCLCGIAASRRLGGWRLGLAGKRPAARPSPLRVAICALADGSGERRLTRALRYCQSCGAEAAYAPC